MFLRQCQSQKMFGNCRQAKTVHAKQTRRDLRVEQMMRLHAEVRESWKVLQGIMQNPRGVAYGAIEIVPVGPRLRQCLRIEQADACTGTLELHQPILMPVTVSGGTFRVGGQRACSGRQKIAVIAEGRQRINHIGYALTRLGLRLVNQREHLPRITSWFGGTRPTIQPERRHQDPHRHSLMESKTHEVRSPWTAHRSSIRRWCSW